MSKELSYKVAVDELEQIVHAIERDDIEVDELLNKVDRASKLIEVCNAKLKKTELEVSKILEGLNASKS